MEREARYEALLRDQSRTTESYHLDLACSSLTWLRSEEAIVCKSLAKKNMKTKTSHRTNEERKYSFDMDKIDSIFDGFF